MYNLIKRVIEAQKRTGAINVAELTERIDTFYLMCKVTTEEYKELTEMLTMNK